MKKIKIIMTLLLLVFTIMLTVPSAYAYETDNYISTNATQGVLKIETLTYETPTSFAIGSGYYIVNVTFDTPYGLNTSVSKYLIFAESTVYTTKNFYITYSNAPVFGAQLDISASLQDRNWLFDTNDNNSFYVYGQSSSSSQFLTDVNAMFMLGDLAIYYDVQYGTQPRVRFYSFISMVSETYDEGYGNGFRDARQQYGYYSGGTWYTASQQYTMGYNNAKNEFGLRGGVFGNANYWFSQGQLSETDLWGSLLSAFFGVFAVLSIQILPGIELGYFVGFFLVLSVASMIIGSFMIRRK